MSDILACINTARNLDGCVVNSAVGFPDAFDDMSLDIPDDLREFYSRCGGMELFQASEYPLRIVSPSTFRLANPAIVGEVIEDDITSSWYIFAEGRSGEFVTVDLHPSRRGRCYDSYIDRHGIVGSCPILALSFTEFLKEVLNRPGSRFYWLLDSFKSYGDAYEGQEA